MLFGISRAFFRDVKSSSPLLKLLKNELRLILCRLLCGHVLMRGLLELSYGLVRGYKVLKISD